jgi:hypothetical protein
LFLPVLGELVAGCSSSKQKAKSRAMILTPRCTPTGANHADLAVVAPTDTLAVPDICEAGSGKPDRQALLTARLSCADR